MSLRALIETMMYSNKPLDIGSIEKSSTMPYTGKSKTFKIHNRKQIKQAKKKRR